MGLGSWPSARWLQCAVRAEKVSCAIWLMCSSLEVPPMCGQMVPVPLRSALQAFGVTLCPTSTFPNPPTISWTCWFLEVPTSKRMRYSYDVPCPWHSGTPWSFSISGMLTTRMMTKTYHQAPLSKLEQLQSLARRPTHPACGFEGLSASWKSL